MLLPLLLLACAAQAPHPKAPPDFYRRAVTRALERAQAEVFGGIDLEVDHSRWENPWIVQSTHYEVRTTHSYAQGAQISRDLEFMYGEFEKLLGPGKPRAQRRQVWIFPTMGDYNRFGNENGEEHSSMLGSFFSQRHAEQPVASYQNGNPTWLGMWITHSALHQFIEQDFGKPNIVWVEEGLASYFALFWDWQYGALELERIEKSTFIPLERLVADPITAYSQRPDDRFIELGMLFHFLLNTCEATRNGATGDATTGPFQEFLRAAIHGQDVSKTEFFRTFDEDAALLEEDFKQHDFAKQ